MMDEQIGSNIIFIDFVGKQSNAVSYSFPFIPFGMYVLPFLRSIYYLT